MSGKQAPELRKNASSAGLMAAIGGVAVVALVGATFAVTQLRSPHSCGQTSVAGGAIGGPFEMINHLGQTVTDIDVVTEPTLIYFGYTFCPDVCPLDVARNAAAVDILAEDGHSVTPVFISIDPERDTVDVVAQFVDNFHPKMIGLTGSDEQVAMASRAYRTVYQRQDEDEDFYLMQHSTLTYLVMPETGFVEFFRQSASPEEVANLTACFVTSA